MHLYLVRELFHMLSAGLGRPPACQEQVKPKAIDLDGCVAERYSRWDNHALRRRYIRISGVYRCRSNAFRNANDAIGVVQCNSEPTQQPPWRIWLAPIRVGYSALLIPPSSSVASPQST